MYAMNSSVPAPYQLDQNPYQALKRGGKARKSSMVLAHFNPHELEILDHLQGHQEKCKKTGLRSYNHLEELLKNPHIMNSIHEHVRHHHASGGSAQSHYGVPELDRFASHGTNGDTAAALIGHHTNQLFDRYAHAMGTSARNPHDGAPAYWSLGGMLGGLWNGIKSVGKPLMNVASAALPFLKPAMGTIAQTGLNMLGNKLGGGVGNFVSGMSQYAPSLVSQGMDRLTSGAQPSPMQQAIGQGMGHAFNAYQGGANPQQALGKGMHHTGQQMGGGFGGAMAGAGSALQNGQGYGDVLRQGARGGFQGMGGMQGLQQAGQNALSHYQRGGGFGGSLQQGLRNYSQGFLPSNESMENMNGFNNLPMSQTLYR